jgi:hypothetical protein
MIIVGSLLLASWNAPRFPESTDGIVQKRADVPEGSPCGVARLSAGNGALALQAHNRPVPERLPFGRREMDRQIPRSAIQRDCKYQ